MVIFLAGVGWGGDIWLSIDDLDSGGDPNNDADPEFLKGIFTTAG